MADYHRARGETGIADLIVKSRDTWFELCDAGRFSLTVMRPEVPDYVPIEPDPIRVAFFRYRMTSFAASAHSDAPGKWFAPGKRVTIEDVASGIAAARDVRDSGVVRSRVAAAFIDTFIEGGLFDLFDQEPVWSLLSKLQSALSYNEETDAYEVPDPPYRRIEECTGWTPGAWVLLSDAYRRVQDRVPALKASWLERFGESELATMLVERPALYDHWVLAPELCAILPPQESRASRRR